MSVEVAAQDMQRYGRSPVALTFTANDTATEPPTTAEPTYSAAFDPNDGIKRHAACDECRTRKLKCSGEPAGCSRCVKQNLICRYSEQKQMGRPRKRQKTDTNEQFTGPSITARPAKAVQSAVPIQPQPTVNPVIDPNLSGVQDERAQFESVCSAPIARTIRTQRQTSMQDSTIPALHSSNSDTSHSLNGALTPDAFDPYSSASYPTDVAQWPDFSTMDMLPLPLDDKFQSCSDDPAMQDDPDVNPEALSNLPPVPACPCLPNLYLTLSTLSTLSSFPFNSQTISTLETALRTAQGVIYCNVCPQKFDSGSSNLMLGCTLLNVLADHWNRMRRLGPEELRKAFGTPEQQQHFVTTKEGLEWRAFAHRMIRAYVFGDHGIPTPPQPPKPRTPSAASITSDDSDSTANANVPSLTLMSLCDALTRRQRQWHRLDEPTDEFCDRVTPDLTHGHIVGANDRSPGKHLCLEIVEHAKCIVRSLDEPFHKEHGFVGRGGLG